MRDRTVAARYAKALLILTDKRGETPRALEDLHGLLEVLKPGTRIGDVMASPEVRLADKRSVLKAGFEGRVLRSAAVFVDLLLRKKRLGEFPTIVAEFEALVERAQGIQRARVVSAVPLTVAELERLHHVLEQSTRSRIKLDAGIDPALLGGAFVRIGDRVLDRSVRSLLDAIARQLHEIPV